MGLRLNTSDTHKAYTRLKLPRAETQKRRVLFITDCWQVRTRHATVYVSSRGPRDTRDTMCNVQSTPDTDTPISTRQALAKGRLPTFELQYFDRDMELPADPDETPCGRRHAPTEVFSSSHSASFDLSLV